jgi:hypothetical protein
MCQLKSFLLLLCSSVSHAAIVRTVQELNLALNSEDSHIIIAEHLDIGATAAEYWTASIGIPTPTKSFTVRLPLLV